MQADSGGLSTFGALSTVLFAMGKRWQMRTPPYIILLIRTFLTLEGVVAPVDRAFNVYSASLPWAIRRLGLPPREPVLDIPHNATHQLLPDRRPGHGLRVQAAFREPPPARRRRFLHFWTSYDRPLLR